jgi:hypothetical protein
MAMKIEHFLGDNHDIELGSIDSELKRSVDGFNEFVLTHSDGSVLVININQDMSVVHWFPSSGGHPGFVSVGERPKSAGVVQFRAGNVGESIFLNADLVVPAAIAFAAAREFLVDGCKPRSVRWFEL